MKTAPLQLTRRDLSVLNSLDRHPLTAEQLLRISQCYEQPFSQLRLVQRRLKKLADRGLIKSFPFALLSGGSPRYYKLTRCGYSLVHGRDAALPKRRHFEAISPARHRHTHGLSEAMLQISLAVSRRDWRLAQYARENSFQLKTDAGIVFPDGAFQIQTNTAAYNYFVEFDMGSERIRSTRDTESIERKFRVYDEFQAQYDALDSKRPVVLFVTQSNERLNHIISAATAILCNPNRTVMVGASMKSMMKVDDLLQEGFLDNRGRQRGLTPATLLDKPTSHEESP